MKAIHKKRLRVLGKILFVLYIAFLLYFLIYSDWYGRVGEMSEYHYNLQPFREIRRFWIYRESLGWIAFANLVGNVVIFIPIGFFMPMASKYRHLALTTLYSLGLSLFVETFQLITKVGSFDVDDIILNTAGGVLGYLIFVLCNTIRRRHDDTQKRENNRKK